MLFRSDIDSASILSFLHISVILTIRRKEALSSSVNSLIDIQSTRRYQVFQVGCDTGRYRFNVSGAAPDPSWNTSRNNAL